MALTLKDRVLETAAAPGTGAVTLLGAVTGYQTFSAAIGNGNTCYYTIADQSGANWEVGLGTYASAGNTLTRTTVLSSSNAGSTVNFASGTQNVFVTYPSEKAVYLDASGNVQPSLGTATFSSITDSGLTSGRVTYAGTSGLLQDSANLTFNGTTLTANTLNLTNALGVAYGGTGLTTLTSGYIPYGNGTGAFSSSANLYFSGSNLGIGTSSPASQLQVSSSGNTPIDITSTGTGAVWTRYNTSTYYFDIGINNSAGTTFSTDAYANVLWGANNYPIVFATNNTERMRLTSAGYLGIGTSSPSYTLDVQSGSYAQIRLKTSSSYDAILGQDGSSNFNISNGGSVRVTLDTSGNLGLGVTPSAWNLFKAVQIGNGSLVSYGTNNTVMYSNAYYGSGGNTYISSNFATQYQQNNGQHIWYTAPSGTAGNAISFTQALTLDNSGNLLVGTTSNPNSAKLVVSGATAAIGAVFSKNASNQYGVITQNNTATYTNYIDQDSIGSNTWSIYDTTNNQSMIRYYPSSSGYWQFFTNGYERMRIDSSGNLLVGATSTAYGSKLYVNQTSASTVQGVQIDSAGSYAAFVTNSTSASFANTVIRATTITTAGTGYYLFDGISNTSTRVFGVFGNGNVVNTNNSYGAISDISLKENIVDATPKLDDLMKVQIRQYNLKSDPTHKQIGVIAQELETVFPSMVEEADGIKGVKYSVFVPMLIKALQEQQAIIEQLKQKVGI